MPLIAPALRLAYIFLNVFETFKTLRLPPPSARNGGRPSVRAMSQRKRAMKGCITVWLVWCCFAMYERTLDPIVRLFIPFYDELKSLVIIFFMLTRARGAEPIYLHVIRPAVKPYSATLDAFLELTSSVGDFALLLAAIPVEFVSGQYHRWSSLRRSRHVNGEVHSVAPQTPSSIRRTSAQRPAELQPPVEPACVPLPREDSTSSGSQSSSRSSLTFQIKSAQLNPPAHEIWYPPPTAYGDIHSDTHTGLPTPPADNPPPYSSSESLRQPSAAVDEWRQYPDFPSAYPPTPLPVSSKLPSINISVATPFSVITEEAVYADERSGSPEPMAVEKQDFHESLPSPRELSNPDSDGASSDDDKMHGIHIDALEETMTNDDEMDDEESDNDLDTTLRTPFPRKRNTYREKGRTLVHSTSIESLASRSTGLSTTHHGSLRTRTSSLASTTPSLSDSHSDTSSIAGQKRPLPVSEKTPKNPRRTQRTLAPKTKSSAPQTRTRGTGAAALSRANVRKLAAGAGPIAPADSLRTDSDDGDSGSSVAKRRRVGPLQAVRPLARTADSDRTIRAPSRAAKDSRLPQRRPLSHVVSGQDDAATAPPRKVVRAPPMNARRLAEAPAERKTRSTGKD